MKAKSFHEENNDKKIHDCVPSRMKRKLSVDINTEVPLMVKPKLIILTKATSDENDLSYDEVGASKIEM